MILQLKKLFAVLLALLLPCTAFADVTVPPENTVRFDVSYDEFMALGEKLFAGVSEESDDLNHMNTFPVLPASLLRLIDEFRDNTSTLEKTEYGALWNTEALRIAYDEKMLGVQVWAEFGNEEKKLGTEEKEINWKDGSANLYYPDGYAFEDISALRICYSTGTWLDGDYGGQALFDLTCAVSDGKIIDCHAQAIMECIYCMDWALGRYGDDQRLILSGGFENLATDASWYFNFDTETGEPESEE